MKIYYGIEINCESDSSSYGDTSMGMVNGIIRVVTGNPGLSGNLMAKSFTGYSLLNWFDGVLADGGLEKISERINIKTHGNIAEVSSFGFTFCNAEGFFQSLRDSGITLWNKRVTVYMITTSNDLSFTFRKLWQGKISNNPYTDMDFNIQCEDDSSEYFRRLPFPPRLMATNANLKALEVTLSPDMENECLPVSVGYINKAKFPKVYNYGGPIDIATSDSDFFDTIDLKYSPVVAYSSTTANNITTTYVEIRTGTKTFGANALRGYLLTGIEGPNTGAYVIKSNDATAVYSGSQNKVRIYLYQPLDTALTGAEFWDAGDTGLNIQYFSVEKLSIQYIGATNPIDFFKSYTSEIGEEKMINAFQWLDNEFIEATNLIAKWTRGIQINSTFSNFGKSDNDFLLDIEPAYIVDMSKSISGDGKYYVQSFITPSKISLNDISSSGDRLATTNDFPAEGSDLPDLYDKDPETYYEFKVEIDSGLNDAFSHVWLDVEFPPSLLQKYDKIYPLINASFQTNGAITDNEGLRLVGGIKTKDYFDRVSRYLPSSLADSNDPTSSVRELWVNGTEDIAASTQYPMNLIPPEYFGDPLDENTLLYLYSKKSKLDFSEKYSTKEKLKVFPGFRFDLNFRNFHTSTARTFFWRFHEMTILAEKAIEIEADAYYSTILGETFTDDSADDGRIDSGAQVTNVPEYIEYLIRQYQYPASDEIDPLLDTDSFDSLSVGGLREDWKIGIQHTDRNENGILDAIQYACKYSFLGMGIDATTGKRYLRAWREQTESVYDFTASNINRGSISGIQYTDVSEIFNEFEISYDKSQASGSYNKIFAIRNVNKRNNFPDEGVLLASGSPLWKEYVLGIADYTTAKSKWDRCRETFEKYGVVNRLEEEIPLFVDYDKWITTDEESLTEEDQALEYNSAYLYLENCLDWNLRPKKYTTLSVPITPDTFALNLLDPITFYHPKYVSDTLNGWIVKREIDLNKNKITFELLFEPLNENDPQTTVDTDGLETINENKAPDNQIINENGADAGDIYTENE